MDPNLDGQPDGWWKKCGLYIYILYICIYSPRLYIYISTYLRWSSRERSHIPHPKREKGKSSSTVIFDGKYDDMLVPRRVTTLKELHTSISTTLKSTPAHMALGFSPPPPFHQWALHVEMRKTRRAIKWCKGDAYYLWCILVYLRGCYLFRLGVSCGSDFYGYTPKFNIDPKKWRLEDYFPFKMLKFQGLC